MNKDLLAAISAAINAYIEQEGQARALTSKAATSSEIRSRWHFGRQEVLGARVRRWARGDSR
jgi:hypothetical protein